MQDFSQALLQRAKERRDAALVCRSCYWFLISIGAPSGAPAQPGFKCRGRHGSGSRVVLCGAFEIFQMGVVFVLVAVLASLVHSQGCVVVLDNSLCLSMAASCELRISLRGRPCNMGSGSGKLRIAQSLIGSRQCLESQRKFVPFLSKSHGSHGALDWGSPVLPDLALPVVRWQPL